MSIANQNLLEVSVDKNRKKAYIQLAPGVDPLSIDARSVANQLHISKIAINDGVKTKMHEFLDKVAGSKGRFGKVLIAEAMQPIEAQQGAFHWPDSAQEIQNSEEDFESLIKQSAVFVTKGAVVGKITPPKNGKAGFDVFGQTLPPETTDCEPIQISEGLQLAEDGITVISNRPGRVVFDSQSVALYGALEIDRDIKPHTEKRDWEDDVIVRGNVGESSTLTTTQSLIVTDSVEAAEVLAGNDIIVHCGIIGKGKGKIAASRDTAAKFCEDADIRSGRNVFIGTSAINSRIRATGHVFAANASIVGGETQARLGLEAQSLGSDSAAPTSIHVGVPPEDIQKVRELDEFIRDRRAKIEKIKITLGPLQANLKQLNNSQKEQVTELAFEVDSLETEIADAEKKRMQYANSSSEGPYVKVLSIIHEGVQITLEDTTVSIGSKMKGPIRIERRKVRGATEIVAVSETMGSVTILKSRPADSTPQEATT